jgi:hypothetical protein
VQGNVDVATKPNGTKVRRKGATVAGKEARGPRIRKLLSWGSDEVIGGLKRELWKVAHAWRIAAAYQDAPVVSSVADVLEAVHVLLQRNDVDALAELGKAARPAFYRPVLQERPRQMEWLAQTIDAFLKPKEGQQRPPTKRMASQFLRIASQRGTPLGRELRQKKLIATDAVRDKVALAKIVKAFDRLVANRCRDSEEFVTKGLYALGLGEGRRLQPFAHRTARQIRGKPAIPSHPLPHGIPLVIDPEV